MPTSERCTGVVQLTLPRSEGCGTMESADCTSAMSFPHVVRITLGRYYRVSYSVGPGSSCEIKTLDDWLENESPLCMLCSGAFSCALDNYLGCRKNVLLLVGEQRPLPHTSICWFSR